MDKRGIFIQPYIYVSILVFLVYSLPRVFANMLSGIYSPAELHTFDPTLFVNDLDVVSIGEGYISPRLCSLYFMKCMLSLGLSYENIVFLIILAICIVTSYSIQIFINSLNLNNKFAISIIAPLLLCTTRLCLLGNFAAFEPTAPFIGLGIAFSTLAISTILTRPERKGLPYVYVTIAAMSHIHEGIWGFLIILLVDFFRNRFLFLRNVCFWISVCSFLLLTIPSLLHSAPVFTDSEFYNIYVVNNAPGCHLLFASQHRAFVFSVIVFPIVLYLIKDQINKDILKMLIWAYVYLLSIVALWIASTIILPNQTLIKLYIPKGFKYVTILYSLYFLKYYDRYIGDKVVLTLLLGSIFLPNYLWIVSIICVRFCEGLQLRYSKYIYFILLIPCIYYIYRKELSCSILFIFMMSLIVIHLGTRFKYYIGLCSIFVYLCFYNFIILNGHNFSIGENMVKSSAGQELYDFSIAIGSFVPKEEVILCDGEGDHCTTSTFIQHISKRSVYELWWGVPSNESAIQIWNQRRIELKDLSSWNVAEYANFMRNHKLSYCIIDKETVNKVIFDTSFNKLYETNHYALYKLAR